METKHSEFGSSELNKIPKNALYLGLLVKEPLEKIYQIVIEGLIGILELFPTIEDAKILLRELEENTFEESKIIGAPWKYPKQNKKWHLTTLFKKGNSFLRSHPAFLNFEESKQINVSVRGIVYIPKRILTAIVSVDTPVENDFPHITTLIGTFSPKHSNDVLNELFSEGKSLFKEYEKVFKEKHNEEPFVQMVEINVLKKNEKAYVYKFQKPIELETEMKVFYS